MTDTPEVKPDDAMIAALCAIIDAIYAQGMRDHSTRCKPWWKDVAAMKAEIEPVLHWYQSDEHPPRPLQDIVRDIIADLQSDRKNLLALQAENARFRDALKQIANCTVPSSVWPDLAVRYEKFAAETLGI